VGGAWGVGVEPGHCLVGEGEAGPAMGRNIR